MDTNELRPEVPNLAVAHRLAGKVKRWHSEETIREQTIADHVYNIMRIYLYIWGNPEPSLFCRIMFHDFEELYLGDLPHWAGCIPELKTAYRFAEDELLASFPEIPTSHHYDYRIKICDWIEALEFMINECLLGNSEMRFRMEKLYRKLVVETSRLEQSEEDVIIRYLRDTRWLDRYAVVMLGGTHGQEIRLP